MKIETRSDKQKSKALLKMAETTLKRLNEIDKLRYPSNTLDDYYDIIHQLMEALTLIEGIKMKGDGAHYELIDHVCEKYKLGQTKRDFLQRLRNYRNRISYEGFSIKRDYIERNDLRINEIIKHLSDLVKKKL